LDEEFIDYFGYAKDGSWWVYTDTIQNKRDSFYLTEYKVHIQYLDDKPKGDSYQSISYKLNSSDKINLAELTVGWMYGNDSTDYFNYNSTYSGISNNYFYNFPLVIKINDSFDVEDCITCGIELIANLQLPNYEFEEVIKVWKSSDTFYFAPRIGLIRFYENSNNYIIDSFTINE